MAIMINIYYIGTDGSVRKIAEEMVSTRVVKAIRGEWNLKYDQFFPMNDTETVLIIESQGNQEAINLHHASPMMDKIMKLCEKYDLHM